MKYNFFTVVFLSILMAACATGPSEEEMEATIKDFALESESRGDTVDVYIYYLHGGDKRMVIGDVTYYIDDAKEPSASLGYKQHIHIQTTPGTHKLRWHGPGKKVGSKHYDAITLNLEKGKTYIFRQIHDVIFNRYSDDGLSVISSLKPAKSLIQGKYYLSQTERRD